MVGTPDPKWGQKVTALVQLRDGAAEPSFADLVAHCRTLVADYKSPKSVYFVPEVVHTPVGKLDYVWAKKAAHDTGGRVVSVLVERRRRGRDHHPQPAREAQLVQHRAVPRWPVKRCWRRPPTTRVSVVVLTGAGRAFSAGQDLEEMAALAGRTSSGGSDFPIFVDALQAFPKPVIAAVQRGRRRASA